MRVALMLTLAVLTFPIEAWADDYYYVAEFNGTNTLTFKKTTTAPDNKRTSFDATNTGNSGEVLQNTKNRTAK